MNHQPKTNHKSARPNTSMVFRYLCSLCIGLLSSTRIYAQVDFVIGDTFPEAPTAKTWYYRPTTKCMFSYDGTKWNPSFDDVKNAYLCAGNLVVETYGSRPNTALLTLYEGNFYSNSRVAYCFEGLAVYEAPTQFDFVDSNSTLMGRIYRNHCNFELDTHSVQGITAFCIPKIHVALYNVDCKDIHTWGMLGSNGKWLIEPKFDKPFRFQNGFADVLYYGQKRKINENGEWIE